MDKENLTLVEISSPSEQWIETVSFLVEGVLLSIIASIGLVGNTLSFIILSTQAVQRSFHNLLLLLSVFDTLYLITSVSIFGIPSISKEFVGTFHLLSLPVILPLIHIGTVGSIFTTLALSIERYLTVAHPFARLRYGYSSRHFIIPVVLYSVLFNLPKFFELTTSCPESAQETLNTSIVGAPGKFLGDCLHGDLEIVGREMRGNYWYLNIYILWLNTLLNILFPVSSLIVLNIIIFRKIEEHLKNLGSNRELTLSEYSSKRLKHEKTLRKREVLLSRISVYIVGMMVSCHTIRIVPNTWEIIQTFNAENPQNIPWPPWVRMVTMISHLALTLSCSLSFYIYYAKYGTGRKGLRRRLTGIRSLVRTLSTLGNTEGEEAEHTGNPLHNSV